MLVKGDTESNVTTTVQINLNLTCLYWSCRPGFATDCLRGVWCHFLHLPYLHVSNSASFFTVSPRFHRSSLDSFCDVIVCAHRGYGLPDNASRDVTVMRWNIFNNYDIACHMKYRSLHYLPDYIHGLRVDTSEASWCEIHVIAEMR